MYRPLPNRLPCWANQEDTDEYSQLAHSVYQNTILESARLKALETGRKFTLSGKTKNAADKPYEVPWKHVPNIDTAPPSSVGSDQVKYEKKKEKKQKRDLKNRLKTQIEYQAKVDENRKKPPVKLDYAPKFASGGIVYGGDEKSRIKENDPRMIFKLPVSEQNRIKELAKTTSSSTAGAKTGTRAETQQEQLDIKTKSDVLIADEVKKKSFGDCFQAGKRNDSIQPPIPKRVVDPNKEPTALEKIEKLLDPQLSTYQAMSVPQGSRILTKDSNRPFVMVASKVRTHEAKNGKLTVKPHTNYGRRPDAPFDIDGYPMGAIGAETEFERRDRQKLEYAKQWEERVERKKKGKQVILPVYANKTQAKRYKDKLVSTYGLMSAGKEEWMAEREKNFEYAKKTNEYNTDKGNTGTYYFGQEMQPEDFVELNRGVKRTELSEKGYKGEYDWSDLLYKIDPTETPLSYIPERVEGVVTAPESYKDRDKGRSKYGEQDCIVKRTAL
ncbi:unnamed protein product [Amoebophrya sp. A120]|nr:unnamed protein product [Amoebophrya sp. A120]|eukprot:GSA120T00019491001.1